MRSLPRWPTIGAALLTITVLIPALTGPVNTARRSATPPAGATPRGDHGIADLVDLRAQTTASTTPTVVPTTVAPVITAAPTTTPAQPAPTTAAPATTAPSTTLPAPLNVTPVLPPPTYAPAPSTTAAPTTTTTIAGIGDQFTPGPVTIPLRTTGANGHVDPLFAWLSAIGFALALVVMLARFVITRPGGRDRAPLP